MVLIVFFYIYLLLPLVRWKSGEVEKGALGRGFAAVSRGAEGGASRGFPEAREGNEVLCTTFKSLTEGYTKLLRREITGYPQDENKKTTGRVVW